MKALWLAPLAFIAPGPNEQDDGEAAARQRYRDLVVQHTEAQALDVAGTLRLEIVAEGETITVDQTAEAHLAKPLFGTVKIKNVIVGGGMDQTQEQEFLADGEAFYALDHDSKVYFQVSERIEAYFPDLSPMRAWAQGEVMEPKTVEVLRDEAHPDRQGLRVQFSQIREDLWFDASGRIVAADVVDEEFGEEPGRSHYEFSEWKLSKAVDVDGYRAKLPEGYSEYSPNAEYEAGFIEVGAPAPNVTVTTMAGEEVQLSSLKGKTVLLNFWFYH